MRKGDWKAQVGQFSDREIARRFGVGATIEWPLSAATRQFHAAIWIHGRSTLATGNVRFGSNAAIRERELLADSCLS